MSSFAATRLVAGRELRETTRRKTFWVILAAMFLASGAGMVLPDLIDSGGPTAYDVVVVGDDPALDAAIQAAAESDDDIEVRITHEDDQNAARRAVESEDADVALVLLEEPVVIVEADGKERMVALVQQVLGERRLTDLLVTAGIPPGAIVEALDGGGAQLLELDEEASGRRAASAILSIVLYMVLLMLMIQAANGTAIEKANRISEVLLAVVRPGALMFGKVLGVGIAGFATTAIAAVPVLVKLAIGGDLPDGLGAAVASSAAWLLLGLALYLTLASALGALVERQEEAGAAVGPLNVTLLVGYLVAQTAPESPLATVLAYVPLTSPLVVPVRVAIGVSSPMEMVLSLLIGVATVFVIARFAAVVYRRAIVRTGRKLKLRDVLRPS